MLQAALVALGRLDVEHAAVYFQVIYNVLREPMRRALEALVVMQRQTENKAPFPPLMQRLIDESVHKAELDGKRSALFRLVARVGVPLSEDDRARILACTDGATLDRWFDNVLGAKTASDVLS